MENNKFDILSYHVYPQYKELRDDSIPYVYLYENGEFKLINIEDYEVANSIKDFNDFTFNHGYENNGEELVGLTYLDISQDRRIDYVVKIPHKKDIPMYVRRFIVKTLPLEDIDCCYLKHRVENSSNKEQVYMMFQSIISVYNDVESTYIKDEMDGERQNLRNDIIYSFDWSDVVKKGDRECDFTNQSHKHLFYSMNKGLEGINSIDDIPNVKTFKDRDNDDFNIQYGYIEYDKVTLFFCDNFFKDGKTYTMTWIGFNNTEGLTTNYNSLGGTCCWL